MEIGQRVGERYELERVLGEGGSAIVWAARDLESGDHVAVKLLKEATVERRLRFGREVRAAMAIEHPSVVRIRDVGEASEGPFLVMELLEGETLDRRFAREGALGIKSFANLFARVVSAVGQAHALGIVHRDLKPGNLFLVSADDVRVLDFGLAKLTFGDSSNVTETGDRLGTPRYMSPEQVQGRRDIDHKSDVWSLGILFHEALAGEHPVPRGSPARMFERITRGDLLSLENKPIPRDLVELVRAMTSVDRNARPELAAVLEVLRRHAEVAVDDVASARMSKPEPWRHEPTRDETVEAPRTSPSLWPYMIAMLVVIAAAVAWVVRQ